MPPHRRSAALGALPVALALALAVFVPGFGRAADDLPNELMTVDQVRFEGRHAVPAKELRAVIKTREPGSVLGGERPLLRSDFLRADTLSIDLLYRQHGYLDAHTRVRIDPASESGTVRVTFVIAEGKRTEIDRVIFEGVHSVPEDQLRKVLYARSGRAYNPYYLNADTARIVEVFRDRGYFPHVDAVAERHDRSMTVRYLVDEGPLYRNGEVAIPNLADLTVKEHMIRRELTIKPGATYRSSKVQQSVQHLYESGLFNQVEIVPLVDTSTTVVAFELFLRERRRRWVDGGIGSGTSERLRFTGEWGHRNLWARGVEGVLAAKLALDSQARFLLSRGEASALEPWLFGTRTRGLGTVYFETRHDRSFPGFVIEQQSEGISVQLRRQAGRYLRVALTQDNVFMHQRLIDIAPGADPALLDSLLRDVVQNYTTHRLQLAVERETRDHPIQMTRGSYQAVTGEIAGGPLKGTSSFTKGQFLSTWYTPVRPNWLLATRAHAGIINPFGESVLFTPGLIDPEVARVPLEDRFRIGGVNSLRGYDENEVPLGGGLVVLQANVELRVSVIGPLGVELYMDAGNVWAQPKDVSQGSFAPEIGGDPMTVDDVRYTFGLGPRLQLPFGPLRVDFTWWARPDGTGRREKGRAQFAIGPAF